MAISRPCPRCQQPMEIPQPVPDRMQCAKCGAVIKNKRSAGGEEEPKSAPSIVAGKPAAARPAKEPPQPARSSGFLAYLHSVIPKPVLFGFYGALGGLLGVLLLGQLLWQLLCPTPSNLEPLRIAVPSALTLYAGSQNTFKVRIERLGFDGPIRVEAVDVPEEFEIPAVTIPPGQNEIDMQVTADEDAEETKYTIRVRAVSLDDEKVKVDEPVELIIEATPPSLQLRVSPIVTTYAPGQNRLGFILSRRLFDGPVRLEVLDLPKGVTVPLVELPEKATAGAMNIAVAKNAKVGESHILTVEVHSLANHKISARETFQLNVEPPPGKLQLAVSPQVTLYPGTKNKITVKIARQEFTGPIQLDVTGAPRGVHFESVTIPADKNETEIEVFAAKEVQPGGPPLNNLRVTAKAMIAEKITASVPLVLKIEPPAPTMQLAVSPRIQVYPGGKATFGVKIARQRFTGPVRIDAQKPGYLTIAPITIPADQTEGEMEVSAGDGALALPLKFNAPVTLIARSKGTAAAEKMQVEILAPPSDLQLTVSPEVEVYQAGQCKFTIKVARSGFLGPVQIKFNRVPAGVTLAPGVINANDIVWTGKASIDAPAKRHDIEIEASGPRAPDGKTPTTTQKFTLAIKPFDPTLKPPLDIVFVLDVTQSLDPQIAGLRDGIGQFVKALKDKDLEPRIGLVAFRDIIYDKVPFEWLKFNGQLFTTDTKAFSEEVGKLKAMGGGDDPESSLDAIVEAAKYPFRPGALRVLLLITDEKPQTKGNSVPMKRALEVLAEKKIDQVHLVIKKADLPDYQALQNGRKGGFFDFQQASKKVPGTEGFASLLPLLSKEIATTLGAPEPVAKVPPLPGTAPPPPSPPGEKAPTPRAESSPASPRPQPPQPPTAGEASVIQSADPRPPESDEVSPPPAEARSIQGLGSTQLYAEKDRIWLLIATAFLSAALAAGIALTLAAAQKRYLRQAWLSLGESAKTLAAGLIAGLFAGAIGQWFFQSTPGDAWWSAISRILGWAILGGLIGGGMGFFVPNLKWQRAFLGGLLGGFLGGLGFVLVSLFADSFLGRLIGGALLGLFIGVMVALAEITSRRYWLEVAFGEREVRTVTLGAATLALGGDEKQVGVYVPNAPPKAFGYRVDKNRVFVEDFVTGKTIEARPGDERTLGSARIKVCSLASAKTIGVNLQLALVRDVPLLEGMPLTSEDIPGLEPQGADGIVALVSRRPNNPKVFLLRNRSKQPWLVMEADGKQRKVEPGLSIELSSRCEIDFGQAKGVLDPGAG